MYGVLTGKLRDSGNQPSDKTTTGLRFLNTELCVREPESFWRENVIVVLTFLAKKVQ